ncbi:hypothetical protein, partial [Burkholderia ubonensis]|uniref:hypothetical protein n=1 Tax=Burkholderia ubonensis TaxID=101571 RepID=UPI001E4A12C0
ARPDSNPSPSDRLSTFHESESAKALSDEGEDSFYTNINKFIQKYYKQLSSRGATANRMKGLTSQ